MAVTLANLIDGVNDELENRTHFGSAEVVADGVADEWDISPLGYSIMDDADFLCLKDGTVQTEPTDFTMNFNNGVCTLSSVPTVGTSLRWYFNYRAWSDTQVTRAVNAGIQSLFPSIYCEVSTEVACDGSDDEFDLSDYDEFVKAYDWKSSSDTRYTKKRMKDFEIFKEDTHKVISFFDPPDAGTLRIHTISRPRALSSTTDELVTEALIPDRTMFPIISYACYYLLTQKVAPRARGDVAIVTQGSGTLSPRQMNDAANAFYLRHQMQLATIKMPPWSMR